MTMNKGGAPAANRLMDMVIAHWAGEYAALLEPNGFRVNRLVPTTSAVSVIEAVLA